MNKMKTQINTATHISLQHYLNKFTLAEKLRQWRLIKNGLHHSAVNDMQ